VYRLIINHSASATGAPLRAQAGVGFVEILVCVLLLSFGFLVVAQMQLQGIRTSQSAFRMSQASYMITEMMDKINRNPAGLANGDYDAKSTGSTATKPNCATTGCTPAQSAQLDLYDWSANLHNLRGLTNFSPLIPPNHETIGDTEKQRDLTVEFIP